MTLKAILLAGAAVLAATPALADDAAIIKRLDDLQKMMQMQQQQIEAQRGEIATLKKALRKKGVTLPAAPVETAEAPPAPGPPSRRSG